jgi:hypothetical protein
METGVTNLDGASKQDPRGKAYDDLAKIFPDMDGDIEAIGHQLKSQGVDPLDMEAMSGQESAAAEDAVDVAMKGIKPVNVIQIEYEILGTVEAMMNQGGSYERVMDKIEDFITNEIGQQYVDKGIDIVKQAIQNKDGEMTFDDMINQIKSTGESTPAETPAISQVDEAIKKARAQLKSFSNFDGLKPYKPKKK